MVLDSRTTEGSENLESLAVRLGETFLKQIGDREKVVGLFGTNPEVLDSMKEKLDKYFEGKGEKVTVKIGSEGYLINVDYFITSIDAQ